MIFLGVDFGWQSQPSGLASLNWDGSSLQLASLERLNEPEEILCWVKRQSGAGGAMVAVDAPLVIGNATGMRVADREAHALYGRYHAGCYPANQSLRFAARTTGFSQSLALLGFEHAFSSRRGQRGRFQIEVFPHIASVQLFGLDRILKYKRGRLAQRKAEQERLRLLILDKLPRLDPPLRRLELPETPTAGFALKAAEDMLDALLCAYAGAYWWFWGEDRNVVLGSRDEGYLVAPKRMAAFSQ